MKVEKDTLGVCKTLLLFGILSGVLTIIGNENLIELYRKINISLVSLPVIFAIFVIISKFEKITEKYTGIFHLVLSLRWIVVCLIWYLKDLFSETDYIDIKIYSVIFILALFYILSKKKYDVGTCICIFLIWLYTYLPDFVSGGENSAIIIRLLIMSPISFIIQCQYESFSSSNTGSSENTDSKRPVVLCSQRNSYYTDEEREEQWKKKQRWIYEDWEREKERKREKREQDQKLNEIIAAKDRWDNRFNNY